MKNGCLICIKFLGCDINKNLSKTFSILKLKINQLLTIISNNERNPTNFFR